MVKNNAVKCFKKSYKPLNQYNTANTLYNLPKIFWYVWKSQVHIHILFFWINEEKD